MYSEIMNLNTFSLLTTIIFSCQYKTSDVNTARDAITKGP